MKKMMRTMTMIKQIAQRKNMMKHRVNLIKEMMGIMRGMVIKVILMETKKDRNNNNLNTIIFSNSHTINLILSFLCWH